MSGSLLGELRRRMGATAVLEERADLAAYEKGWRYGAGKARAVVRPSTPAEVANVLARCHQAGVRVQPVGANTGLVGASNPDATGVMLVLSLERLNRVVEVDPVGGVALVEAGVTLGRLNEALAPHGLMFPIDLGADPQLGGMIATNAGGTRLLRYGDVRANLLGLEVALADGTLVTRLDRLYKNNTGLDWKQLFVGTSGTFGVVTRAVVRVVPRPRQRVAVLASLQDGEAALALFAALQGSVGELLSAFEVLSREAIEPVLAHGTLERNPFHGGAPAYAVLVELSTTLSTERIDLESVLAGALEAHLESPAGAGVEDVLVGQAEDFWAVRHQVSECQREEGRVLALDLSVPRARLAEFSAAVRARLAVSHPAVRVADFGHWGDGGTHFNLVWKESDAPADAEAFQHALQDEVYALCVNDFEGSYSAEHGVGPHNLRAYRSFTPEAVRRLCRFLKDGLDPQRSLGTVALD